MRPRSTDGVPSLRLSYRRADVTGFWFVAMALAGLTGSLAAAVAGANPPWIWGVAAAGGLAAPGLFYRRWFEYAVWVWNGSVKHVAAGMRGWVLFVSYFILVTLVGRAGSPIRRPAGGAGWLPIHSNGIASPRDLAEFCRRERAWTVVLRPVILLLALLGDEQPESAPPSSTYTLY